MRGPSDTRPPVGPRIAQIVRPAIVFAAAVALGGCDIGVMDAKGPISAAERLILIDSLAIMLAIVIPVILATLGFAWYFRASNEKAFYWPEWEFSGRLELIVWSIPLLVIIVLGGVAWFGSHALDPYRPLKEGEKPLEIQVVSLDWKWLFIYPDQGVAAINQLTLPAGKPVHFSITSASVWNTFHIPQLGGMIYSMAGMTTQLNLQADDPGTYYGLSAMFSGDGFSDMHFDVRVLKSDAFATWVDGTRAKGSALDSAQYAKLVLAASTAPLSTYKSVEPNLFSAILSQSTPAPAGAPPVTNPQ